MTKYTPEQLRKAYAELIKPPKPPDTPEEERRKYAELANQRQNCGHLGAEGGICGNCGEYVPLEYDPEAERKRVEDETARLEELRPTLLDWDEMEDMLKSSGLSDCVVKYGRVGLGPILVGQQFFYREHTQMYVRVVLEKREIHKREAIEKAKRRQE
jgi:hypothetical protein